MKTIRFIAFFLCCIFSFNTIAVSIDQLINLYDIPSFSGVSESESKILANTTQAFINNPDNMEKLSTTKGKELLKRQKRLLNLIEIQRVFKSCKQKNTSKRKLFMRIYSSASSFNNIEVSCSENITRFSNIYDFSNEVQSLAQEVELDDLQKKIYEQSFKNLLSSYIYLKKNFEDEIDVEKIIKKLCFENKENCDDEQMKIYTEHILDELGSMTNITALSTLEAKKIINNKIDSVNLYVEKIKPKVNKGWFNNFLFDSSDPSYDDESLMAYEDYRQKYLEQATSGIGVLLATKRLQRSAGRLKTMENDEYESSDRVKNTTSYHFKAHSRVTDSDVSVAYREALETMEKQASHLHSLERRRKEQKLNRSSLSVGKGHISFSVKAERKKDLKKLVKTNPAAIGQILAKKPEYSQTVCEVIKDIEKDDHVDEVWDKAFFWGGLVVGGVLMVSGLVALGGTFLARTITSAATFSRIGNFITIGGVSFGSVESSYYSKELIQAQLRMNEVERSFLAGSNDEYAFRESQDLLLEFNESKMRLALALGFTAVDLVGLYGILRGGKYHHHQRAKLHELKKERLIKINRLMKQILNNNRLLNEFKKMIDLYGGNNVAKFIAIVGQVDSPWKQKIFNDLLIKGADEFSESFRKVLKSVKECSQ